jgi:Fe-S-cluster-containing dehydrogenase component
MKQRYLVIDVALCHDCNNCFIACKDEHVMNNWPPYTEPSPGTDTAGTKFRENNAASTREST